MDQREEPASWKILMVDDDEDDYFLVRSMLTDAKRGKCIVEWASTYEAGRLALLNDPYDAVLLDYDLGARNGLDLIREATARGFRSPFILFTGHGSYEIDQEAMRAGATLYLTKGETSSLLLERGIRYAIERKQIESALQERTIELEAARAEAENEKLRLEAVMEALPVGVAITDVQGGNISSNRAFEQVWGTPHPAPPSGTDYAAYKAWWADTGEAVRTDEWASVQAVLQGKAIAAQHFQIRRFDGSRTHVLNGAAPVRDRDGKIVGSAVAIQDVTSVLEAQEELRKTGEALRERNLALQESEAKYRNLFNSMDEGFCIIEMIFDAGGRPVDYRFLEINVAFEEQTGLHEAQGKLMRELAPAHEAHWFEIYGKIAMTGEPQHFENEARALNRYYDVYAYRVGRPEDRHVAIIFNDISQHKLLEKELKESESKYRELIQYAPAAIYEVDFRGRRFVSVNDAMCQMSGYSRDELVQMDPADMMDEPSQRLFQKRISQWLAGEKPDEAVEYRVLVKDGSERYASLNVTFTLDKNGRPRGATVIAHDVTERRRANLLLKERSAAIQEYSQKLEQSNRELENFAFVASHDLREPLSKIQSFSSLLSENAGAALGETERLYLTRIQNATERMLKLVDDLLALSRISSAGDPFVPVDLNQVIRAVQDDFETRLKQTDGKVLCENLPVIQADPVQMHQLFQNLTGNAIKFHQHGVAPVVQISARLDGEKTGETMTLHVADNGIGFDEKYLDLIFEPFQRLHGRSEYEGSGIGLAICKKIVERHLGTINAHSKPGEGATFSVTLPANPTCNPFFSVQ